MWPGRAADHSAPSSAEVLEEWSYTSTPLWVTTGNVTGLLYLYFMVKEIFKNLPSKFDFGDYRIDYIYALLKGVSAFIPTLFTFVGRFRLNFM